MKILITGGAGFIGSHLADALIAGGHSVTCADDLSLGRMENIAQLRGDKHFKFTRLDVCDTKKLLCLCKKESFDVIFHLAANSDISLGTKDPSTDLRRTFQTTASVLECARLAAVPELVFASTSAVYGELAGKLAEGSGPLAPVSLYGAAKLSSEAFISAYVSLYGLKARVVRFPNVIGDRCTHGVIYDFMRRLTDEAGKLRILGDGKQTKPYMYVKDLVGAILFVWRHAKGPFQCYNTCPKGLTSVKQIADITCAGMGLKGVKYEFTGGARGWKGDVPRYEFDCSKLKKLGWKGGEKTSTASVEEAVKAIMACKTSKP